MFTFTQLKSPDPNAVIAFILPLTAEERTRSRHRLITEDGKVVFFRLPRGTVLYDGDILADDAESTFIKIVGKPEPVLTAFAETSLLLRAAYHLGNRHVPVEITLTYLRLSTDSVLRTMLEQLGLEIKDEIIPFKPELGAYGHSHS